VTVWFLSNKGFSEGQAEDAILLGFKGLGQWREQGRKGLAADNADRRRSGREKDLE
jgi:hypothetical protein